MSYSPLLTYCQSYEGLVRVCRKVRWMSHDTALELVQRIAGYASKHHPGRLDDGYIESIAHRIGIELNDGPIVEEVQGSMAMRHQRRGLKRRVLHVTAAIWPIGGHTRTLRNWIQLDKISEHSLVVIGWADRRFAAVMETDIVSTGGHLTVLSEQLSLIEKAIELRRIARSGFDAVILHHTCIDIVPTVAFSVMDCPPIGLVNDCDQAFWVGASITDVVINQREAGARVSKSRRSVSKNVVLPIPLQRPCSTTSRLEARRDLGVSEDSLILVTVGRALKYRPTQSHDFFRTIRRLLDSVSRAEIFVVGLTEREATDWEINWHHPRVRLCGAQSDVSRYHLAADVYVESMPFGSATALLEAALAGLPVILPYAPLCDLFVTNHGLEFILRNAETEEEYLRNALSLLGSEDQRRHLGKKLRDHVVQYHTGEGWLRQLEGVYGCLEASVHSPRRIAEAACKSSPLDVALAEWQMWLNGGERFWIENREAVRAVILDVGSNARQRGDYVGMIEIIVRYLVENGMDWRLLLRLGSAIMRRARDIIGVRCWS